MIKLADNKHCTGCSSCMNVCGKSAITMVEDEEGFVQPSIDNVRCVECGMCMKSCPVLNPINIELPNQKAYAFISKTDRKVSSSGGAFSVFAKWILRGGV